MKSYFAQRGIRIALILSVFVFFAYLAFVYGNEGATFATSDGQGGIELTIDSEGSWNGVPVPSATWDLKDLLPGVDKFWNFDDIKPGDSGENTISIHLEQNPGWVCLDFVNFLDLENGVNEPEGLVDVDPGSGELAEQMEFFAWRDDGDNIFELGEKPLFGTTTQAATSTIASTTYALADAWHTPAYVPGSTYYIGVQWCAGEMTVSTSTATITCDPTTIGNEAQTDSMSVDVRFRATQADYHPGFSCTGNHLEGCTPGYWRQSQHFGNWPAPYTPNTLFSAVFENAFPGKTLLDVVQLNGGGLSALGRHTVAALLNASSTVVDYPYTAAEVIAKFNAVFPGGDYETLKDDFAHYNEVFCPLGRNEGQQSESTATTGTTFIKKKS